MYIHFVHQAITKRAFVLSIKASQNLFSFCLSRYHKTYIRFVYLAVYQCITKRIFILSIKVSQNVRSYFIKSLSMHINKVYMYDVSYLSVDL